MKWLRHIRATLEVLLALTVTTLILCGQQWIIERAWVRLDLTLVALATCLGWLIVTLLLGRVYCSSMCPLGTLQDFVTWLARHITARGQDSWHYCPGNWRLRSMTLLLIAVSMTSDSYRLTPLSDPMALTETAVTITDMAWHGVISLTVALVAVVVILAAVMWMAWRGGRSFCNTVCPVGTMMGAAATMSLMHLEIDPDLCVGCGKCERQCKSQCVDHVHRDIDNSRCVMCMNCIADCPNQAIKYRADRKRLSTPMMMRLDTPA